MPFPGWSQEGCGFYPFEMILFAIIGIVIGWFIRKAWMEDSS